MPMIAVRLVGLVAVIVLLATRRVTLRDLGWRGDHAGREFGRGVLGFIVMAAVLIGILAAAGTPPSEIFAAIRGYSPVERLQFLGIGIAAAAVEETIFRGWLQPLFVRRYGLGLGILVVAVIFDLSHFQFHPLALAGKMVVGLVLGFLRGRDRPLVAPALAHTLVWAVLGTL